MSNVEKTILSIFNAAAEIEDQVEREAFLKKACAGNVKLEKEVRSLIDHLSEPDSVFDEDPTVRSTQGGAANPAPLTEGPGMMIGPYKILQQIGEGGFGVVFMAEQQSPVIRKVALKVIKLGMDTKEVVARFEAERQALALMEHPNIAKVFDAGATDSGRPYFVMELVRGIPMTQFCDENRLNTQQRLELFSDACAAVQHAHQKGIIHRDIKPSNVMVSVSDDRPLLKVIDFGVSKAMQQRLTEKTLFTQFNQFIGTPAYMSPEQARSAVDIDTRSDLYSMGVLLYELLTGLKPFDTKKLLSAGFEEIRRTICDVDPPKPSTRLSALTQANRSVIAHHRQANPDRLGNLIKGELDWIVMKAMEKDRKRRYATASELSEDVHRFLNHEPVTAAAPSVAYIFGKFARRHRTVIWTVSIFILLLLSTTTLNLLERERAIKAETEAEIQQNRADDARLETERRHYYSNIQLAKIRIESGAMMEANRLLDEAVPHRRHWEWHHLLRLANSDIWSSPSQDNKKDSDLRAKSLKFSPDGRFLASQNHQTRFNVQNPESGDEVWTYPDLTTRIYSFDFSPNSKLLALAVQNVPQKDLYIDLRDTSNWEAKLPLILVSTNGNWGNYNLRQYITFNPDGSLLAATDAANEVALYRVDTGEKLPTLQAPVDGDGEIENIDLVSFAHNGRYLSAFSETNFFLWDVNSRELKLSRRSALTRSAPFRHVAPKGRYAVNYPEKAQGESSRLEIIDLEDLNNIRTLELPMGPLWNKYLSPNGKYLLTLFERGKFGIVWELELGRELFQFALDKGRYDSGSPPYAFFSDDERFLAIGKIGNSMAIWDTKSGWRLPNIAAHEGIARLAAFHPRKDWVATASWDGGIKMSPIRNPFAGLPATGLDLDYHPDGGMIAVAHGDRTVSLLDSKTGLPIRTLRAHLNRVSSLAFDANGSRLITGSHDYTARIWNPRTGATLLRLKGHQGEILDVDFNHDGAYAATTSAAGDVIIWDAGTGAIRRTYSKSDETKYGSALAWHPKTNRLLVGFSDSTVGVWDPESENDSFLWEWTGDAGKINSVAFSSDGERVAVGTEKLGVYLLSSVDGTSTEPPLPIAEPVRSIEFSADGLRMIVASGDEFRAASPTLTLIDIPSSSPWIQFQNHKQSIMSAAWSPSGGEIASCGLDAKVVFYRSVKEEDPTSVQATTSSTSALLEDNQLMVIPSDELPPRSRLASTDQIDLTGHYNALLDSRWNPYLNNESFGYDFGELARVVKASDGFLVSGNIRYDARGAVQIYNGQDFRDRDSEWREWYPPAVAGIAIGQRAHRVHLLHTAFNDHNGDEPEEGNLVCIYRFHFADGATEEFNVRWGMEINDSLHDVRNPIDAKAAKIAWRGTNRLTQNSSLYDSNQVYETPWTNPFPDRIIESVDFIAATNALFQPFLVAITLESRPPED